MSLRSSTYTYKTASAGHEWASVRATLWREVKRVPLFSCEWLTCRICVKLTSAVVSPLLSVSVEYKKNPKTLSLLPTYHTHLNLTCFTIVSNEYLCRQLLLLVISVSCSGVYFLCSLLTAQGGEHDWGAASVMYRLMITSTNEWLLQTFKCIGRLTAEYTLRWIFVSLLSICGVCSHTHVFSGFNIISIIPA